jgi:exopolysaccharide biosynthesis polyprenyl glycosylphosphotransferase
MIRGILSLTKPPKTSLDGASELKASNGNPRPTEDGSFTLESEEMFQKALSLERKRSERSRQRFVLMLLQTGQLLQGEERDAVLESMTKALSVSTRETDLHGWYKRDLVVGVICTEIGSGSMTSVLNALHSRVCAALRSSLSLEQMNTIHVSFHVFPDNLDLENGGRTADKNLYPDLTPQDPSAKAAESIKRSIDVVGSFCALVLLFPLLIIIAIAIKVTSKGPILFKQQRMGRYGSRFTFLKFRSMYFQSDATIHQNYVRRFISGKNDQAQPGTHSGVYKIKDDPRVTPIGRFLRKASLDELPQFFNVLRGEMSLVGPRPPIPYEVETYELWHRRRFLEVKPGITGLWQVEGRSRTKFDEMVRLDLKYAKTWSPWLDIKILLRTPTAVLRGDGAY